MFRSILRNFTAFGVAHVADRAIVFLFLVYAARKLGPELFGQFLLIGTYVAFLGVVFTAGLLPVAAREIARRRDHAQPVLEQLLSLRLVLGVLGYTMLLLLTVLLLPVQTFLPLAAVAGASLVIDAFKDSFTAYHTAHERMIIPGAFQVAGSILAAAGGATLLYLDFGVMAILVAGTVVNATLVIAWHIVFVTHFQRYRIRLAFSVWKDMLAMVAPFAPLQLAVQFNRLSSVMMLSLIDTPMPRERSIAFFGAAQQVANFPLGFLFGLRRAMVPPIAGKLQRGEAIGVEFAVVLKIGIVFICFPLVIATSLFSGDILSIVFGRGYLESQLPLQLLGGAAAFWIAATFVESFLISRPEQKLTQFLAGAYVPLSVNLILCLALIPDHGVAGAAFAILVARAVHLAYALHYSFALLPLQGFSMAPLSKPLLIVTLASAGCLLTTLEIDQAAVRAVVVFLVVTVAMLLAGHEEWSRLWRAIIHVHRAPNGSPRP